jgi:hypothetical protein
MANDNRTLGGFIPRYHQGGGEITARRVVKDTTTGVGKGDLLAIASDGKVDRYLGNTAVLIGVAAEASATGVAATILAYIDPQIVYEVQLNSLAGAQDHAGNAASVVVTAYNATLGISKYAISGTDIQNSADATHPITLIGLAKGFNTDGTQNAAGSYSKWEVIINKSLVKAQNPAV